MTRVAVVVPSHERPRRLAALLDALAAQTLPRADWELVIVFDDRGDEAARLLDDHPVGHGGTLRAVRLPAGTGTAPRQRNVGWRAASAPLVAFTDDDCRPEPRWLERLLAAAPDDASAFVQGRTRPDPGELGPDPAAALSPCWPGWISQAARSGR